jgi:hypothetical protein
VANNYCETSSYLSIPEAKIEKAKEIVDRVVAELSENDNGCGCLAEVDDQGVWFHGEESVNLEDVAEIARALVEGLEIDEPFYCSWAYTCSKPRINEFGGGAFVIVRGKQTYWLDARCAVQEALEQGKLKPLEDTNG